MEEGLQLSGGLNIYTHHWCDQIFAPCLYVLFERGCLGNAAGRKNAGKWAGEWILVESTGVERLTRKKKKRSEVYQGVGRRRGGGGGQGI